MMTLALDAGFLIDNIGNAVTLVDRLGGTFGYAGATSDAIFGNFHGHGVTPFVGIYCGSKLTDVTGQVK